MNEKRGDQTVNIYGTNIAQNKYRKRPNKLRNRVMLQQKTGLLTLWLPYSHARTLLEASKLVYNGPLRHTRSVSISAYPIEMRGMHHMQRRSAGSGRYGDVQDVKVLAILTLKEV